MTPSTLDDQLTKYLTDAHSIEQQALAQLKTAPRSPAIPRALSRIRPASSPFTHSPNT